MSKENQWSRDFPVALGCYWVRYLREDLRHVLPFLIEVDQHGVWNFGIEASRDQWSFHDCEFLGPITPEDAEARSALLAETQELKEIAAVAVPLHHNDCNQHNSQSVPYEQCSQQICARTRAALHPQIAEKDQSQ